MWTLMRPSIAETQCELTHLRPLTNADIHSKPVEDSTRGLLSRASYGVPLANVK